MKKLFIEFHSYEGSNNILLKNGFSKVYSLCDNIKTINMNWKNPVDTIEELKKVSIGFDDVYVTSMWADEILIVYLAALEVKDVNFIVGGPAAIWLLREGRSKHQVPSLPNFEITGKMLPDIFSNYKDRKWGLCLPDEPLDKDIMINFLVAHSRHCPWGKCKFCEGYWFEEIPYEKFDYSFAKSLPEGRKIVFYSSPEATTLDIENLTHIINNDKTLTHQMFWRDDTNKLDDFRKVMDKVKNTENIIFHLGIEYLSNKVLKYINKGLTTEDHLKTIEAINEYGSRMIATIILGWNNLEESDVDELQSNFEKMDKKNMSIKIRVLRTTQIRSKIFDPDFRDCKKVYYPVASTLKGYDDKRPEFFKYSNSFFYELVNDKQIELNNKSLEVLKEMKYKFSSFFDAYTIGSVYNELNSGLTLLLKA